MLIVDITRLVIYLFVEVFSTYCTTPPTFHVVELINDVSTAELHTNWNVFFVIIYDENYLA